MAAPGYLGYGGPECACSGSTRVVLLYLNVSVKFFLSHKACRATLISVYLALSQTRVYTARPRILY